MRKVIFTLLSFFTAGLAVANNITVGNTSLSGQNTAADYTMINFDVAWENGWRTSTNENNYDGAWIFVKYRKNGTTDWRHCTISGTGNTPASGASFSVPTDGKGAFIYRSADGIGNVSWAANQLRWNYGADGVLDNETVEIRVFALEMVYIPQGSFYLGSGGTETNAFYEGSTSATPYLVASNNAITLGTAAGNLNPNGQGPASGSIPAAFPKGFNAFWAMKYECSQQQYADFLNHLDLTRANANYNTGTYISGTHPNLATATPDRGAGYIGAGRTAALADWSGLRPMSELEFEKASRGFNTPAVPNEYVWGNTTLNALTSVTNAGLVNEAPATPTSPTPANATIASTYSSSFGTRVGMYARPSGADRTSSGGTYYGLMNMGDNYAEVVFSMVNAQGRAVDAAVHGDGYLNNAGDTNIPAWQAFQAYGQKGGAYNSGVTDAQTSRRAQANLFLGSYNNDTNQPNMTARLARTAQ